MRVEDGNGQRCASSAREQRKYLVLSFVLWLNDFAMMYSVALAIEKQRPALNPELAVSNEAANTERLITCSVSCF